MKSMDALKYCQWQNWELLSFTLYLLQVSSKTVWAFSVSCSENSPRALPVRSQNSSTWVKIMWILLVTLTWNFFCRRRKFCLNLDKTSLKYGSRTKPKQEMVKSLKDSSVKRKAENWEGSTSARLSRFCRTLLHSLPSKV